MNPPASRWEKWRYHLKRFRAFLRRGVPFVAGVIVMLLALILYNALFPPKPPLTQNDVDTSIANALASATPPPAFSAIAYQVIQPSVVLVETHALGTTKGNVAYHWNNLFNDGSRRDALLVQATETPAPENVGSGVVIDANGDILTALHVVAGQGNIRVTFADGTQSSAVVTATQPENDIAVLQASQPPQQLAPATLGNPNSLRIGDEAYVVGNPFSLSSSLTAGVVSGLDRSYTVSSTQQTIQHLIQVDAAANPGSAGGPLIDRYGQVMGIVTVLLNPTGQDVFIGIAFAVPITTAGGAAGLPPD